MPGCVANALQGLQARKPASFAEAASCRTGGSCQGYGVGQYSTTRYAYNEFLRVAVPAHQGQYNNA